MKSIPSCLVAYVSKVKVSKGAKIRNRYNQVQHLTQDTNGKVTNNLCKALLREEGAIHLQNGET